MKPPKHQKQASQRHGAKSRPRNQVHPTSQGEKNIRRGGKRAREKNKESGEAGEEAEEK